MSPPYRLPSPHGHVGSVCQLLAVALLLSDVVNATINRHAAVSYHNPVRSNTSSTAYETPVFLGNGRLGFSADITGLQSLVPFNSLSSWAWHNDSLPTTSNQSSPADFHGLDWDVHGRQVEFDQPNPDLPEISQWMIGNPHRLNLARLGLAWEGDWLTDVMLGPNATQRLDLWTGTLESSFKIYGESVVVRTAVHPHTDTVAVQIESQLLRNGSLGVLLDYPYASGKNKFDAPFVGVWNATEKHSTSSTRGNQSVTIQHDLDATTYFNLVSWQQSEVVLQGPQPGSHRYGMMAPGSDTLYLTSTFSPEPSCTIVSVEEIFHDSVVWWQEYWGSGGFVALTGNGSEEVQRRIILSQYLMAANTANCPLLEQESGLVNNGWYGKFHLEMAVWHSMHYILWGKPQYVSSMLPAMYNDFLPTSLERAEQMGYTGARWGKMMDPSGRSALGEINSLLIWQQPHPIFFADQEYRFAPLEEKQHVLEKWSEILDATADFMASFAWWNQTTGRYDLGPPMYPSSENTDPHTTLNPAFELAYWQVGLQVAADWRERLGRSVPAAWIDVRDKIAPLPTGYVNGSETYVISEGLEAMWTNTTYTEDHPSMMALLGFMPRMSNSTQFNIDTFANTYDAIQQTWNFTTSFGWDFPMLAGAAQKLGRVDDAFAFLLDPDFQFDDVGMPVGGSRVPTPYFPSSGSLLVTVGSMVQGWVGDDEKGVRRHLPEGWEVNFEGFPHSS